MAINVLNFESLRLETNLLINHFDSFTIIIIFLNDYFILFLKWFCFCCNEFEACNSPR